MTRKCILPSGFTILMTDTVGFIQDLPTSLIAAFRSTLEEVKEADLILHVVDSSNPDYFQHESTVNKLLSELETDQIPQLTVYNKRDAQLIDFVPSTKNESVQISALNDEDCEALKQTIESKMIEMMDSISCRSSFNRRKTIISIKK